MTLKTIRFLLLLTILVNAATVFFNDHKSVLLAVEPQSMDGSNLTLFPEDQALADSLKSWGYHVKPVQAKGMEEAAAEGMDVILLSATSQNTIGRDFSSLEIPLVACEALVYNRILIIFVSWIYSPRTTTAQTIIGTIGDSLTSTILRLS